MRAGPQGVAARRAAQARRDEARRSSSRAPSIAPTGWPSTWPSSSVNAERIHGNRSQAQRTDGARRLQERPLSRCSSPPTSRRAASTSTRSATSSTSTCRWSPEDYIHRVGRTGARRADRRRVHVRGAGRRRRPARDRAAIGKRLPRVTVPDFDYSARATERFEVPHRRSASPRSARARRRSARAPGSTPSGARRTGPAAAGSASSVASTPFRPPASSRAARPPPRSVPKPKSGPRTVPMRAWIATKAMPVLCLRTAAPISS